MKVDPGRRRAAEIYSEKVRDDLAILTSVNVHGVSVVSWPAELIAGAPFAAAESSDAVLMATMSY